MSNAVDQSWERDVIQRLALAALSEQKATRRWGILFKFLFFAYLIAILVIGLNADDWKQSVDQEKPHTALIDLAGVIQQGEVDADYVVTGLREAFEQENVKSVILRINSPGGSPVQAGYIYREMKRLKALHPSIPVYAVISDVGASAAYYIASAADEIYADPASMVGSIGAAISAFGFVESMQTVGVERRFMSAGDNKGFLDPFSPLDDSHRTHALAMLEKVHGQFIDAVKAGRGDRLKGEESTLFSGLVWTGEESVELGLVDGLGSSSYVAREIVGEETIIDYSPADPFIERLVRKFGASVASVLTSKADWQLSL